MFTIDKSFFDSKLMEIEKTLDEFKLTKIEKQVIVYYFMKYLKIEKSMF